jgi:hypothetical protein
MTAPRIDPHVVPMQELREAMGAIEPAFPIVDVHRGPLRDLSQH